jgi:hypothetical protein
MLFKMKVNPKIVQEILGHSEISMIMDIYSHMLPTMQEDAIGQLDQNFMKRKKDQDEVKDSIPEDDEVKDDAPKEDEVKDNIPENEEEPKDETEE